MNRLVATTERAFPKATVELEASLSTQAVAGSRVSRAESLESRERAEVESGRAVSRESRVGGELKGADEESRSGCWVRLEVAFLVHHAAKSAP